MTVALVRFTPGARTNWHSHAVGQTRHVTEGVGLVGTRDGSVLRVHAGETVVCPPGDHVVPGEEGVTHVRDLTGGGTAKVLEAVGHRPAYEPVGFRSSPAQWPWWY